MRKTSGCVTLPMAECVGNKACRWVKQSSKHRAYCRTSVGANPALAEWREFFSKFREAHEDVSFVDARTQASMEWHRQRGTKPKAKSPKKMSQMGGHWFTQYGGMDPKDELIKEMIDQTDEEPNYKKMYLQNWIEDKREYIPPELMRALYYKAHDDPKLRKKLIGWVHRAKELGLTPFNPLDINGLKSREGLLWALEYPEREAFY